ncbi:MAG: cell division protein FtsQ/DivIB [Magnetovibrio sp.]|nr:cell division protein FtsQ/DivIB [Magnetovibrio sp.]
MKKLIFKIINGQGIEKPSQRTSPKRKRVVPMWRRTKTILATAIFVIAVTSSMGTWAFKTGLMEKAFTTVKWAVINTSVDFGFTLDEILVTGRSKTNRKDLLKALGIVRGAPLLAYDFETAKKRVEHLPWVRNVRIERRLPQTLRVHLIERQPIAIWQNKGTFALVDEDGEVIANADVEQYSKLIQVVGADAPGRVGGLLELLATQPELKSQVLSAARIGGRRWDLRMENGIDVRLPEQDAPGALTRLAAFEIESGILGKDVKILDLRLPDRVIVRRAPKAVRKPAPRRSGAGLAQGAGQET